MPYGRLKVDDETFVVRIAPEAVVDWLGMRPELRAAGFPDRPPDIDTETVRMWVPHPGEENDPFFDNHRAGPLLADDLTTYPVYIAKWEADDLTARLTLDVHEGTYRLSLEAIGPAAKRVRWPDWVKWRSKGHYSGELMPSAAWETVEYLLAYVSDAALWPDPPDQTTYFDILAIDTEVALAEADVARGFPSPLPEGPVQ